MKKIKFYQVQCLLLHQIIRAQIYDTSYIDAIKFLSKNLCKKINKENFICELSYKKIKKILKYIEEQDMKNNIVSSCISLTLLAHILCIYSNKNTEIVIGVKIENGKVLSHSWLEVEDGGVINFFTDYSKYKIIKKFSLENI